MAPLSRGLRFIKSSYKSVDTPHFRYITIEDSVCSLSSSVAPTTDIAIAFFSSRY